MWITDYSMAALPEGGEECDIKKVRFGRGDLKKAVIKKVTADEIVIELTGYRAGNLVHILPGNDCFEFTTIEGGKR